MNKTSHILLLLAVLTTSLFMTGCNLDGLSDYALVESGGEYKVTDQYDNTLTLPREQAKQLATLSQEDARAFLAARFRSKFPASYASPGSQFIISAQETTPVEVAPSSMLQTAVNLPGAVAPGIGTTISVGLNTLLGLFLIGYRSRVLKQLTLKQAALTGAGRLIDGVYNIAETLPDHEQGRKIVRTVDQGLELVSEVAGAAEELKAAVRRTETPSIDTSVYN